MKKTLTLLLLTLGLPAQACVFCNEKISEGIYNSAFYPNLLTMMSAFIVLAIIIGILIFISARRQRKMLREGTQNVDKAPLMIAAMILGIGIGGLIDGIVLHQILQWHEMLSNKIPATTYEGKSINMFWDGIFHAFCVVVLLIGIVKMWKLQRRFNASTSGTLLVSGLITGWAVFNIVEGIIDHHLLKLHNVIEVSTDHDVANFAFLGVSVLMLIIGIIMYRRTR